ncbi:hypothetical protein KAJ41_02865 [Candidatus Parcubacteria bacterium]|nr:hypothetical protein [Candidatus Parcubacteria bacterium]
MKSAFVRDTPKNHGKPTMVDGFPLEKLSERAKVLIVDDVFTTGESIKAIIGELPEGSNCEIFVICNRSGIENPEINGVEVNYIFTEGDLLSNR